MCFFFGQILVSWNPKSLGAAGVHTLKYARSNGGEKTLIAALVPSSCPYIYIGGNDRLPFNCESLP